jgi:hypothetical protein
MMKQGGWDARTCDAFDETAGAGALAVVLVTVDDLVDQYAADLVRATVLTVYDVLAREVDLLGRFRACGIRYALHGSKDEQYGLHAAKRGVGDQRVTRRCSQPPSRTSLGPCLWSCRAIGGLRR